MSSMFTWSIVSSTSLLACHFDYICLQTCRFIRSHVINMKHRGQSNIHLTMYLWIHFRFLIISFYWFNLGCVSVVFNRGANRCLFYGRYFRVCLILICLTRRNNVFTCWTWGLFNMFLLCVRDTIVCQHSHYVCYYCELGKVLIEWSIGNGL